MISDGGDSSEEEEDQKLTKAWLDVSKDVIAGTDQSGAQFWERVTLMYTEKRPPQQDRYKRPQNAVVNRWKTIRLALGKFCGCFTAIKSLNQSGKTDEDRVQDARSILRDEPTRKALPDGNGNLHSNRKRSGSAIREPSIDGELDRSSEEGSSSGKAERPSGIKTQKAARARETSSLRMVDAAIEMARISKRKPDLEEKRFSMLE
ncbi:hypothetical protein ON010_g12782 [Phytophthora cinnamomi]|nr:hypothetical protein ON010_g12782 [Phytophthora cinnamomi]